MKILDEQIGKLVARSYHARRARDRLKYWTSPLYQHDPLVIYQMGKVGSSTMERTLTGYQLNRPIFRAHALVAQHMQIGRDELGISAAAYYQRSKLEADSYYLAREIARARKQQRGQWRFITMVRDPVAQNISSFFQLIDMVLPNFDERLANDGIEIEEVLEVFLERYTPDCIFNQWFDVELKRVLGIDVFAHEFDHQKGYRIYEEGCFSLLVLRLESLNECAPAAFKEFLGLDDFQIVSANKAEDKAYSDLYSRFKSEASFPKSYLAGVYEDRYVNHFYSGEEVERFRARLRAAC